jgi:hypothetical protein
MAHDVLSKASQGLLKASDWKDVSCALALVTGRRMAEIHLSASFVKADEFAVYFTGQLKGKESGFMVNKKGEAVRTNRADYNKSKSAGLTDKPFIPLADYRFTIPTLVPADLVVAGLQWLEDNGKRLSKKDEPEAVNRKYSRYLSERVVDVWTILDKSEMTFHKFRGAYFRACVVNCKVDGFDYMTFATSILGDGDEATIKAYQRFEIKPDSLTKLG